jgi:hypothetical protein
MANDGDATSAMKDAAMQKIRYEIQSKGSTKETRISSTSK